MLFKWNEWNLILANLFHKHLFAFTHIYNMISSRLCICCISLAYGTCYNRLISYVIRVRGKHLHSTCVILILLSWSNLFWLAIQTLVLIEIIYIVFLSLTPDSLPHPSSVKRSLLCLVVISQRLACPENSTHLSPSQLCLLKIVIATLDVVGPLSLLGSWFPSVWHCTAAISEKV